jgi:hypothetical protein
MAININIQNSGITDQQIQLFDSGGSGVTTFYTAEASFIDNTPQDASGTIFPDGAIRNPLQVSFTDGGATVVVINLPADTNIAYVSPYIVSQMVAQGYVGFNCAFFFDNATSFLSVQTYDNTGLAWIKVEWDSAGTPLVFNLTPSAGGTFCLQNPFVSSVSTVPLNEIMNSANSQSYLVTSLYVFSLNRNQITSDYTLGRKDVNGNVKTEGLDLVFDPYQSYNYAIRTKDANGFMIDGNTLLNFTLKAQTTIKLLFEFEQLALSDIRKGSPKYWLNKDFAEKRMESQEKADDFQNFYFFE